ncbi:8-oxo-dGTP diphosphatase MutT [Ferrimonas balearica]|nr:8-oxo-dGTP diphosphatase MutT [Ferrimonas balearica]MBY5981152.1 8-oxo-dGTP diphosphatase MutT [Ferrimonas balearica]
MAALFYGTKESNDMAIVQVAIGLVVIDGAVLVAKRHKDQHQGGLWEFPGGKVEPGETPEQAVIRECQEEVGLTLSQPELFDYIEHDYGDRQVQLSAFLATAAEGEAHGREGNPLRWCPISELAQLPMPAANGRLIEKLLAAQ